MFTVAGATGHTGAVVAETLLDRGQAVRVLVRAPEKGESWRRKGAEVAVASLDDAAALATALADTQGVYLLLPPNHHSNEFLNDQLRVVEAMAAAIRTARPPHVVFLSSIGAHLPAGTGVIRALHAAEQHLRHAALNLSLLRAPYFMENWVPVLGEATAHGRLPTFLSPTNKIPMIASRDIGSIAAACLLDRPKGVRVLELAGPRDYSPADVARALSRQLSRIVVPQHAPLSAVVPTFTSMGFSVDVARLFEEMYAGLDSGHIAFEDEGCCRPRGLITLEEWVAQQVNATQSTPA